MICRGASLLIKSDCGVEPIHTVLILYDGEQ